MPQVNGFVFNTETGNINMYAGDTGSFFMRVSRENGDEWPSTARLLYTVKGAEGIVLQRIYRLDDQWGVGDVIILVEFHNDDTDDWTPAEYATEMRVSLEPVWEGTPSTARCVNALAAGAAHMVEGVPVRTVFKGSLMINSVDGRI